MTQYKFDEWLHAQDPYRDAEALEALEEKYLATEEHESAFEIWQRDCLPEYQPITESVLDTYLQSGEYARALDEWVERWLTGLYADEGDEPEEDE